MTLGELRVGKWYKGLERFVGNIALWNGTHFIGYQCKFGMYLETSMKFYPDMDIKELDESARSYPHC